MPKVKTTKAAKLGAIVKEYPDLRTEGDVLFCTICSKEISAERTFLVRQHLESAKHLKLKDKKTDERIQLFLPECSQKSKQEQFSEQLCKAFISRIFHFLS